MLSKIIFTEVQNDLRSKFDKLRSLLDYILLQKPQSPGSEADEKWLLLHELIIWDNDGYILTIKGKQLLNSIIPMCEFIMYHKSYPNDSSNNYYHRLFS
jgi:hypothetical protein